MSHWPNNVIEEAMIYKPDNFNDLTSVLLELITFWFELTTL